MVSVSPVLARAAGLLRAQLGAHPERPVLAAIDGRCGSGKSTLATLLAAQFPACLVVHLDDFYLPPARRIPGWETTPAANMDLARFRDEVLAPARAGQPVRYHAWSCAKGQYKKPRLLAPQPLVLAEGSYSQHPLLAGYYDCRLFVTCSPAEQARRLRAREGARYAAFAACWVPLEEGYFAAYKIQASADLVLDTGAEPLC